MRRVWAGVLGFVVLAALTLVPIRQATAAPRAPDWLLILHPGDRAISVHADGRRTGPLVIGRGIAGPDGAAVSVERVHGTGRFSVTERMSSSTETEALLVFFANAVVDRLDVWDATYERPYRGPVVSGRGSRAITAGASGAEQTVASKEGIAGAYDVACIACRGTWTAPLGRTGTFSSTQVAAAGERIVASVSGRSGFSGPPGRWTMQWRGTALPDASDVASGPVTAAWAPIGKRWTLFEDVVTRRMSVSSDAYDLADVV